jgi:ABC-2 type transport system ATP-binding protein
MICDSVAIINHGRIVARDSITNLSANRQMKLTLVVRGPNEEILKTLAALPGVEAVQIIDTEDNAVRVRVTLKPEMDVREQLSAEIIRKGWGLIELRPERASLEEIFLQTTAKEAEAGL